MNRIKQVAAGLLLASSGLAASTASAEVSYNIGYASEYYFRGILQKSSSASAGADFTQGGLYAGIWTADVGDGLEVDVYGGYGIETDSGFSASIGATGYYYTGQFDDKYEEINLNFGYGMFGLEYSFGKAGFSSNESDYDFLAVTVTGENGLYGKAATFGQDADGDYLEFGYGTTVSDIDLGVSYIISSKELGVLNGEVNSLGEGQQSEALIFTIGKTF
ncbi:MAG: TorF family putative porin [Pseudomonadales bacterium]|nr:TorF family putative porin [Pseudomonadales bacterium]